MAEKCIYCGRVIVGEPEVVVRRGVQRTYCSDFCYKLHFYDAPGITYDVLRNMYDLRCVSVKFD